MHESTGLTNPYAEPDHELRGPGSGCEVPAGGRARSGTARRAVALGAMAAGMGIIGAGAASADPGTDGAEFTALEEFSVSPFDPSLLEDLGSEDFSFSEEMSPNASVSELLADQDWLSNPVPDSPWVDEALPTVEKLPSPADLLGEDWEPFPPGTYFPGAELEIRTPEGSYYWESVPAPGS